MLLFAFDALLGGGPTRTAHAFVMVPFQLVTVAAVWALRTRRQRVARGARRALAAERVLRGSSASISFPTALLALGLLFALRERWGLAGAAARPRRGREVDARARVRAARRLARLRAALAARGSDTCSPSQRVFAALHLPFLLWSPSHTVYAYRYFHGQGVTGESIWYLLLAPLGRASVSLQQFWLPAHVPPWVNPFTTVVQVVVLLALAVAAWRVRASVARGCRARRDGAGALPAPEPRLQPAVPRADGRGVGDRRRARRSTVAASSSCSAPA